MNEKTEALYRELGPGLYARAHRVLGDDKVAEEIVKEVCAELALLGDLPKLELAKKARELVKARCDKQPGGSIFDSHQPGTRPPR